MYFSAKVALALPLPTLKLEGQLPPLPPLFLCLCMLHEGNDFENLQTFSEIDDSIRIRIEIFTEIIFHKKRKSKIFWKLTNLRLCKEIPYGDLRHRSPLLPHGNDLPIFKQRTVRHLMLLSAFLSLSSPCVTGQIFV